MSRTQGHYAHVNGLKMYYEVHGSGEPLVLLHGGAGAIEIFAEILPALADHHQVIGVDLQAHGRTADIDRPLRYELMADDIAALVEHLRLERVDVMGYSLGGGVALRTAIQHPDAIGKLVLVSAPFRRSGWYPEVLERVGRISESAEPMKRSPMYQLYASIAPRPEDWTVLFAKLGELLRRDYDWSEEVKLLRAPALIAVGDADGVRASHAVEFFELLGGGKTDAGRDGSKRPISRLAILPYVTHYDIFASPALVAAALPFLDARAVEVEAT